jgi:SAM-dependent methyltransferase
VTSFTAFHWIADQKKALECVASCLKPGGHFLIHMYLRPSDAWFQTGENLKAHPKWSPFLKEIKLECPVAWENFKRLGLISNLSDSSATAEAYKNLASEVGLQVESSKPLVETLAIEEKKYRVMVAALSPFFKVVPEEMKEGLLDDFLFEFKKIYPPIVENDEQKILICPERLLVWGVKKM